MLTRNQYNILRILNNSSIIVNGTYTSEQILIGKGIGFGYKVGDVLPRGSIYEKAFQITSERSAFYRIIHGYDDRILDAVFACLHMLEEASDLGDTDIMMLLAEHLCSMCVRVSNHQSLRSFFSKETPVLYPQSYKLSGVICNELEHILDEEIVQGERLNLTLFLEHLLPHEHILNHE